MDRKLKARESIASLASHFTKRNSAFGSVRGLPPARPSAGPSAGSSGGSTSNQEIADARRNYLKSRARILEDYHEQRGFSPVRIENLYAPLESGNGDIRNDFAALPHISEDDGHDGQIEQFERVLLDLYGVDTLVSQVDNMWVTTKHDAQHERFTYNRLAFLRVPKRTLNLSHGAGLRTAPIS
jgi:hypothetical protein